MKSKSHRSQAVHTPSLSLFLHFHLKNFFFAIPSPSLGCASSLHFCPFIFPCISTSPFLQVSNPPSHPPPPSHYLSGQLSVLVTSSFNKSHHWKGHFHWTSGRNKSRQREQMVIFSQWHRLASTAFLHYLVPSLAVWSHMSPLAEGWTVLTEVYCLMRRLSEESTALCNEAAGIYTECAHAKT